MGGKCDRDQPSSATGDFPNRGPPHLPHSVGSRPSSNSCHGSRAGPSGAPSDGAAPGSGPPPPAAVPARAASRRAAGVTKRASCRTRRAGRIMPKAPATSSVTAPAPVSTPPSGCTVMPVTTDHSGTLCDPPTPGPALVLPTLAALVSTAPRGCTVRPVTTDHSGTPWDPSTAGLALVLPTSSALVITACARVSSGSDRPDSMSPPAAIPSRAITAPTTRDPGPRASDT